jgi:F-type H+-transporting ATPase subunit b
VLLDWFTIIAQVFNFLVLVLLLRRFLYRPILRMMDERQAKLAKQIQDTELLEQEAAEKIEAYEQQRLELLEKRQALLDQAQEDADEERHKLMNKARHEVDETRSRWLQAVEQEKEGFLLDLRQHVALQTSQVARRALLDLADLELEAHVARVFTRRLKALDERQIQTMQDALQGADTRATLRSAFPLPEETRQEIEQAIHQALGQPAELSYVEDGDLLCGIELHTGGYKLSWSLAEYLEVFEKNLLRSLESTKEDVKAGTRDFEKESAREIEREQPA